MLGGVGWLTIITSKFGLTLQTRGMSRKQFIVVEKIPSLPTGSGKVNFVRLLMVQKSYTSW